MTWQFITVDTWKVSLCSLGVLFAWTFYILYQMRKSNIIKPARIWIYWKLANIPFHLCKWYVILYLITLWTEKQRRLNPGKTVVTCMEIFPRSVEFHGKHVSIKNKHFQNSCKFVENYFFFWMVTDPQTTKCLFHFLSFQEN